MTTLYDMEKSKKEVVRTLRFERELWNAIMEEAHRHDRKYTDQIRHLIKQGLEATRGSPQKDMGERGRA